MSEGYSLYRCLGGCGYHFAVEFKDFGDDAEPVCCPSCSSDDFEFLKDVEMSLEQSS